MQLDAVRYPFSGQSADVTFYVLVDATTNQPGYYKFKMLTIQVDREGKVLHTVIGTSTVIDSKATDKKKQ